MGSLPRRLRRLRRRIRPYVPALRLLLVVFVLSAGWFVVQGVLTARDLRALQNDLVALRDRVGKPQAPGALDGLIHDLQKHARGAQRHSSGLNWKVWSHTPFLGSSLTVTTGVSATATDLAERALPALTDAAQLVPTLRRPDGSIDLTALHHEDRALQAASHDVSVALKRVEALPVSRIAFVQDRRAQLQSQLRALSAQAQGLAVAAAVGPSLLGSDGPRNYLLAVQNNSEARASGGIVGAYGLLELSQGKATLHHFGSDNELAQVPRNAVDLGPEWRSRYDVLGQARDWREVTTTPDFPTAGRAMMGLWSATHGGQQLDGVLSVDPLALHDLLQATGPVTRPDGQRLDAETYVQHSLSDAYRLFPDKAQRSAALAGDARAIFAALTSGRGSPSRLAERLGHAVVTRHLKLYSARAVEQQALQSTSLADALPRGATPLLEVVTQDGNNDKLSYYLRRQIRYDWYLAAQGLDFGDGQGPRPQQVAVVTIRLTNTAPRSGLPAYVAPNTYALTGAPIPPGRMFLGLSVYLGASGQLDGAVLDGKRLSMTSQTEQGLAVLSAPVTVDTGQTVTVVLHVRQPAAPGRPLSVLTQPLAVPDQLSVQEAQGRTDALD